MFTKFHFYLLISPLMIDNFGNVVGTWWWEWQAWCWWSTCKYLKNVCNKNNFLFLPYITLHKTKKIYFMKNGESRLAGSQVQSCLGYDFPGGKLSEIWGRSPRGIGGILGLTPPEKGGILPGTHLGSQVGLAGSHLIFLPGFRQPIITIWG